jgi:tetratricopeptide (TPR) repeat protein
LFISGGVAVVYALFKAGQLATIGAVPTASASAWAVLKQCAGYENAYLSFMVVSLGLLLVGGFACSLRAPRATDKSSKTGLVVGVIASLSVLATACLTNLNIIRADISLRWANVLHSQGVRPASIEVYGRAVRLNPREFIFRSKLSQALRDQAEAAPDLATFNDLMSQAEQVLLDAQKVSTLNRGAYHLGDLYLDWALRQPQADQKLELARKASRALDQALVFEPRTGFVWNESANVDLILLNQEHEGMRKNQKAIELAFQRDKGLYGDFYAAKSRAAQNKELQRQYALQAIRFYDLAISNAISANTALFPYQMAQGNLCFGLNDWNQALACYLYASKTAPATGAWQVQEMLARTYCARKDKLAALEHLQLAIDTAPPGKKPLLLQFKAQVQKL